MNNTYSSENTIYDETKINQENHRGRKARRIWQQISEALWNRVA